MNKLAMALSIATFSFSSFGAVRLAMEVEYGDKKISPSVQLKMGQSAVIAQDSLRIAVKSEEEKPGQAHLSFKIYDLKSGKEKLLGSPSVKTSMDKSAEVNQTGPAGKIRVKVTPHRAG